MAHGEAAQSHLQLHAPLRKRRAERRPARAQCMRPGGGGATPAALAEALSASFGSVDAFKEQFKAAALAQFGSGWAWLVKEQDGTLKARCACCSGHQACAMSTNTCMTDRQDAQRGVAAGARRHAAAHGGRVGARVLCVARVLGRDEQP